MKKAKNKKSYREYRRNFLFLRPIYVLLSLCAIAACIYYPVCFFDFVNWDDYQNLVDNPMIKELSWNNFYQIFTSRVMDNYNPLPIFTFAIEHAIFGMNPAVFHITNVIIHIVNAFLVFLIVRKFLNDPIWAVWVSLLFLVHPMRVESVAWITERKDVLFSFFYLAAIWLYIQLPKKRFSDKILIFSLFILALFSKIQAVSLPLSFILIDLYRNRNWHIKLIVSKWPYFLASAFFGIMGLWFLKDGESLSLFSQYSFIERLGIGGYSFCTYLIKSIYPYMMSPLYPYPLQIGWVFYLSLFLMLLVLIIFLQRLFRKKFSIFDFGFWFFVVNIIFLLQIVGAGQGYLADRFTYMPYLGLFIAMVVGIHKLITPRLGHSIFYGFMFVLLLYYGFRSHQQVFVWQNGRSLWSHVLAYYPHSTTALANRAQWYRSNDMNDAALADYQAVLSIDPFLIDALVGRGKLYFDRNQLDLAIEDYNQGLALEPNNDQLLSNRGAWYGAKGDYSNALKDLNAAIETNPNSFNAYLNRSLLYFTLEEYESAQKDYLKILNMDSSRDDIWYELAMVQERLKLNNEALSSVKEALRRSPNNKDYRDLKARLLQNI